MKKTILIGLVFMSLILFSGCSEDNELNHFKSEFYKNNTLVSSENGTYKYYFELNQLVCKKSYSDYMHIYIYIEEDQFNSGHYLWKREVKCV